MQLKTSIAELELPLWIITILSGTGRAAHPCDEDHRKLVDWTEEILMTLWRVRWLGDADSLLVWGDNVDLKIMPRSLVTRAERAMKEWSADCLIEWPADATMM